jgi:hypothetical protein
MIPKPTTRLSTPAYPTRREFLAKGTLFLLATGCGGCSRMDAHPVVAPIFEHGEGRAYIGCVSVTSPVFLSEEESLQIIIEELSKEGITLGEGIPLAGVNVEFKDDNHSTDHWLGEERRSHFIPGELDAVDQHRKVGIQFVSREDEEKTELWGGSINTKKVAQRFSEEFQAQAKVDMHIGIFYDPVTDMHADFFNALLEDSKNEEDCKLDADSRAKESNNNRSERRIDNKWEKSKQAALVKSRELLRRQAQDFVAWQENCFAGKLKTSSLGSSINRRDDSCTLRCI